MLCTNQEKDDTLRASIKDTAFFSNQIRSNAVPRNSIGNSSSYSDH